MSSITEGDIERLLTRIVPSKKLYTIQYPTGSGKTTMIPPNLVTHNRKVLVSLPTKIAAKSSYERVKYDHPTIRVDYLMRDHPASFINSDLIYATSGSALRIVYDYITGITNLGRKDFFLIVDEAHTGSVDNSILMSLWKYYAIQKPPKIPTLILMTATPVEEPLIWLGDPVSIDSYQKREMKMVFLNTYAGNSSKELWTSASVHKKLALIVKDICGTPNMIGHILVFVAGKQDVFKTKALVENLIKNMTNIRVFGVHGDTEMNDYSKMIGGSGFKKVIIATNVAESSITIPDVAYVVDSMLEKAPGSSLYGSFSLQERTITKSSSTQRMGRAGRTPATIGKSTYYSILTEVQYGKLEGDRVADIYSVDIHKEVMTMMMYEVTPQVALDFHNSSFSTKVNGIVNKLIELEMVEKVVSIRDDGKKEVSYTVTNKGIFTGSNTQGVESSSFIWEWRKRYGSRGLYECAFVSCVLDVDISKLLYIPQDKFKSRDYMATTFGSVTGPDTLSTIINIWNKIVDDNPKLFGKTGPPRREWCEANGVSYKHVGDLLVNLKICMASIEKLTGDIVTPIEMKVMDVVEMSLPILSEVYSSWLMVQDKRGYTKVLNGVNYEYSHQIPYTFQGSQGGAILCLSSVENINQRGRSHNTFSLFTYLKFDRMRYEGIVYDSPTYIDTTSLFTHNRFPIPLETKLEVSNDGEGGDDVRLKLVTPSDLGFGDDFAVPSFLLFKESYVEARAQKIRVISECLVPLMVRQPKNLYKEVEMADKEEEIILDEEFLDMISRIRADTRERDDEGDVEFVESFSNRKRYLGGEKIGDDGRVSSYNISVLSGL